MGTSQQPREQRTAKTESKKREGIPSLPTPYITTENKRWLNRLRNKEEIHRTNPCNLILAHLLTFLQVLRQALASVSLTTNPRTSSISICTLQKILVFLSSHTCAANTSLNTASWVQFAPCKVVFECPHTLSFHLQICFGMSCMLVPKQFDGKFDILTPNHQSNYSI